MTGVENNGSAADAATGAAASGATAASAVERSATAASAAERSAMALALDLARNGIRGANPLVGAVILDAAGAVLSSGFHRGAGTAHAEADALANAAAQGADVTGATMVVTLEPCNHTGRTEIGRAHV